MTCDHNREVHAWHDGQLSASERREFAAHLAGCAICQAELRELEALSRVLRSGQRMSMPPGLVARLHDSVQALGERSVLRIAEMLTAAAAIVLATGLAFLVHGRGPSRRPPTAPEAVVIDYNMSEEMGLADASTRDSLELTRFMEGRPVGELQP